MSKRYQSCPMKKEEEKRVLYVATCDTRSGWKEFMALKLWNVTGEGLRNEGLSMQNVCKGENWGRLGFLTKPLIYLKFIQNILKARAADKDLLHVILMDSDTFWSADKVSTIWNKYDCARGDKHILLATEMSCWVGRYCKEPDLQRWYSNSKDTPSYSPFVNSGIVMGKMENVAKMLDYVITHNSSYFTTYTKRKFDDQYAIADYGIKVAPSEVALDYHQQLSASCSIHTPGIGNNTDDGWPFVCKKRDGELAMSCPDFTKFSMRRGHFSVDEKSCLVHRSMNAQIPFQEELGSLAADPIIWHGNGAGKRVFVDYGYKSFKCFLDKKHMTIEDHSNTYG